MGKFNLLVKIDDLSGASQKILKNNREMRQRNASRWALLAPINEKHRAAYNGEATKTLAPFPTEESLIVIEFGIGAA